MSHSATAATAETLLQVQDIEVIYDGVIAGGMRGVR